MEPVSFGGQPIDNSNTTPVGSEGSESLNEPSYGNPFLNEVLPQHRDIVAPYLKKWDGNVTKKFQEHAAKIKPYEELGTIEELTKYRNLANNLRTNPEQSFRLMWEGFQNQYGENFQTELFRILQLQEEMENQGMSDDYGMGNEPDPNEVFQQNVMSELEELRAWRQEQTEAATLAEQNAQLDSVLDMMHNQYGEFDDTWVIQRIAEHGDPARAIQEFNAMIGKFSQGQRGNPRQAPKVMGGQGGVPTNRVDTNKTRGQDRRNAVLAMLQAGKE